MIIRAESPADIPHIRSLTDAAFKGVEHSNQTEGAIIDALRQADALAISLVAELNHQVIGHVAFSPILINGVDQGWFGLGPVSVLPSLQGQGVGTELISEGLNRLRRQMASGCVVLGEPLFYSRFGFTSGHGLHLGGIPPEYFQSLVLSGEPTIGEVSYHEGFYAK